MVKKLLALFLVVLMSIESFAAIVSDNDGTSFVTKAEFEALKNDFNEQVNNYNRSIESKIDGAIASYLSGIKVTQKYNLENYINDLSVKLRTFANLSNNALMPSGPDWRLKAGIFMVSWASHLSGIEHNNYQGMLRYSLYNGNPNDIKLVYKTVDSGANTFKYLVEKYEINGVNYFYPHFDYRMQIEHWISIVSASVSRTHSTNPVDMATITTDVTWDMNNRYPSTETKTGTWTNFYGTAAPTDIITHTSNIYNRRAPVSTMKYLVGTAASTLYTSTAYCIEYAKRSTYDSSGVTTYAPTPGGINFFEYQTSTDAIQRHVDTFRPTINFYTQNVHAIQYKDLINEDLSKKLYTPVTRCDGLAICRTENMGDLHIKLNLTSVGTGDDEVPSPTDLSGVTYIVEIKDSKWGTIEPTTTKYPDSLYYNSSVTEGILDINIEKLDNKDTTYWLKIVPSLPGSGVQVEVKECYIDVN